MRSVEIGAHEAIEEFVVAIGELLFECLGASCEPIDKGLSISSILLLACWIFSPSRTLMDFVSPEEGSMTSLLLFKCREWVFMQSMLQ